MSNEGSEWFSNRLKQLDEAVKKPEFIRYVKICVYYAIFLFILFLIFLFLLFCNFGFTKEFKSVLKDQFPVLPRPAMTFAGSNSSASKPNNDNTVNDISVKMKRYLNYAKRSCAVDKREICTFDTSSLGPCSLPPYGYFQNKPCFIFKINYVRDWVPDVYNRYSKLPSSMPEEIKYKIRNSNVSKMWFSCEGQSLRDKQNIGDVAYYPSDQSFSTSYLKCDQNCYTNPMVAVQILNSKRDVVIRVKCHLWLRKNPLHAYFNFRLPRFDFKHEN